MHVLSVILVLLDNPFSALLRAALFNATITYRNYLCILVFIMYGLPTHHVWCCTSYWSRDYGT